MSFLINITSYISFLSKNVFNTKLINQSEIANIICLNLSYLFLVYPANSKHTIMTDEELRAFCLKQAIQIITHKEQPRTMGFQNTDSIYLFELLQIICDYCNYSYNGRCNACYYSYIYACSLSFPLLFFSAKESASS